MILKCFLKGHIKPILICCFVLVNLTASKSILNNESTQVPTSTDVNDLGPTTEVYPNTAANVDVTTNPELVTPTGSQNVVGDAAATTPPTAVENPTTSDVYFSDDGLPTDTLPLISTTQETSLHHDMNAQQQQPSAQIDTPIPQLESYAQPESTVANGDQFYQVPSDVGSSTNVPQEPPMDVLNTETYANEPIVQQFPTDGFATSTQETALLQDVNALEQYPSAQIDAPNPQIDTYTQPETYPQTESYNQAEPTLANNDQFYQDVQYYPLDASTNAPQEPIIDLMPVEQNYPTDGWTTGTQETSLLQDVNALQQHPSDFLNGGTYATDSAVDQFPTDSLTTSPQETSLLQDVNAQQQYPSAQIDSPIAQPEPTFANGDQFYQLSQNVQYHPSDAGSSTNTPQEPVIDLVNSGTYANEPIVQHFPADVASPAGSAVPESQPNFTDAITIPDEISKPKTPSSMMYDDMYDDYGNNDRFGTYDDPLSDDYPATDGAEEPEEANYGLEELSESDLEQLDDNDLQELEDVLALSDDKYDDFGESNLAGGATNVGYSGEVFDDFGEMAASKHIPFKIPQHQNYLKTFDNLKHFTTGFNGYTQRPSFGREEAEDDAEDRMSVFNTRAPGQSKKRFYNDRLVAMLDIYNKRNLRQKNSKGAQLKNNSKALLQTYDALMQIKHRKMGGKGKYVKSYKSKGDRSKQIRRLQRIRRLMALAQKRKSAKTKTGTKSAPQIALSTIAKATQASPNDVPMLSLSSLQNGIKLRFQHPDVPTNPIDGVMNKINEAMYYHPDDIASKSSDSANIQPNPFRIRKNLKQYTPEPRFMEYDEAEDVEYDAPETEVEADEGEDDFLNNLFGISGKRGQGSDYQNNAALYGSCPAVPVKVSGSKVTVTTSEGCQVVISITGSTDGDGKNLGINVSYNNKVIV